MPDPRFFQDRGVISLQAVAELAGAVLADASHGQRTISGAAPLNRAGEEEVSFFSDPRYVDDLARTGAGACFLPANLADKAPRGCIVLVTPEVQLAFAKLAAHLHPPHAMEGGGPQLHPTAVIEDDVLIAPGAVIGPRAVIGRGSKIGANAVIGPGVEIGRDCEIGPRASVSFALLGDRVKVYAGAVIGEAGFGVTGGRAGLMDIPQLGRVILQDGVTVGANSCIDRGAFEDTVIGEDTKIDNLVQIGHNVQVGRGCLFASQVGISGSTIIGDGVRFGGQAGIADHLKIGDGANLMARAGLMHDVPPRETWGGSPAMPGRQWLRQSAWLTRAVSGKPKGRGGTSE
jgi:UDP-3-O-[3-hydroxymyristoyl] glucosamine N-acyltransferase